MKRSALYAVAFWGAFSVAAEAQCGFPDSLDSAPCCTPVVPTLPTFPPVSLQAQGICWNSCFLAAQTCDVVTLSPPTPTLLCSEYTAALAISDCSGLPQMGGTLTLDYTRTWTESRTAGAVDYQVWRFVAKIDMAKTNTLPATCPTPPCLDTVPSCFFYGYVDYAQECSTLAWESSVVLFHGCDDFQHRPLLSSNPGVFHPTETYAIVAPDTVLNPFVPVPFPISGGPLTAEAVRTLSSLVSPFCLAEDFVVGGQFTPDLLGCVCPVNLSPFQYTTVIMDGFGVCGNAFRDINLWPTLPWYDVIAASLGTWTTGATYPGPEQVWAVEGLFRYDDICDPTGVVNKSFDIFYGGATERGFMVLPDPVVALTDRFVDIASNYTAPASGPYPFPIYGSVLPTDHLVYVNY